MIAHGKSLEVRYGKSDQDVQNRPTLTAYTAKREDLLAHARDLFEVVTKGAVKIEIRQTYPLAEASRAHRDVEARKTTGSTILIPA